MRIKMMKTKDSLFAAIEARVAENAKRSEEEKIKIFLDYLKNLVCEGVFGDTEIKCGISGDYNRIVFSDGDVIKDEHNNEIIQIKKKLDEFEKKKFKKKKIAIAKNIKINDKTFKILRNIEQN